MKDWQHEDWDQLMEVLEQEECLLADGFDDALVGYSTGIDTKAVYDVGKMIDVLVSQGMDHDDAVEYLEYNTFGAYMGPKTPLYVVLDYQRVSKVLP